MCSECNAAEAARGSKGSLCESCGENRAKALKRKARKRRRQKHGGDSYRKRCRRFNAPYTPINKFRIYDRNNWACQICGVELLRKYLRTSAGVDPRSPTLDHIIPLCLGPDGPGHVETNVQAACWECNTRRGATPLDSFVEMAANKLP
jgi:5-methylcytosine-specific restriction endonuclease McrA